MVPLSGTFYRIVFEKYLDSALNGVLSPEGRFHQGGEPAFYCSPTAQAASIAIDRYVAANDDARVLCKLTVTGAQVCDIRPPNHTPTLHRRDTDALPTLKNAHIWAATPWFEDRQIGRTPASWKASDAVRETGADGMIYSSRRDPDRWHLVLFRWNDDGGPTVRIDTVTPWTQGVYY